MSPIDRVTVAEVFAWIWFLVAVVFMAIAAMQNDPVSILFLIGAMTLGHRLTEVRARAAKLRAFGSKR